MNVWCTRTHGNGQVKDVANVEMDTWNGAAMPFPSPTYYLAKALFDGDDERDFCGV